MGACFDPKYVRDAGRTAGLTSGSLSGVGESGAVPQLCLRQVRRKDNRWGQWAGPLSGGYPPSDELSGVGGILQSHIVTRFPGRRSPWKGGRPPHLPPSPPLPQRPRGARGARGVPVQGAAGQAVACAAAAAQARLGMRVRGVPWRLRSVYALHVQVGGMGPGGKCWVRGGAWMWSEAACSEGYLEGRGRLGWSLMGRGLKGRGGSWRAKTWSGPSFPSGPLRSIGECVHLDGWTP